MYKNVVKTEDELKPITLLSFNILEIIWLTSEIVLEYFMVNRVTGKNNFHYWSICW